MTDRGEICDRPSAFDGSGNAETRSCEAVKALLSLANPPISFARFTPNCECVLTVC